MSWTPLAQPLPKGKSKGQQYPITITCTKGGDAGLRRVFVTVRPDLIKDPPEFWQLGQGVTVSLGEGDDAGYMQIKKGGSIIIKSSGGSGKTVVAKGLRITLRAWEDIAPGGHSAMPVTEDEHWDDRLELKLPDWAIKTPTASKKIAAVPDKEAKPEQAKPTPQHHGKRAA